MNILLSGPPGVGKTTIIKRVLKYFKGGAAGFYTQEIRQSGSRVGFEIVTLDGEKAILSHVNIKSKFKIGPYGVAIENIDNLAVQSIKKSVDERQLVIIDEIGKMELLSDYFKEAVIRSLNSANNVLATIPDKDIPFVTDISQRDDADILKVTMKNRNQLGDTIKDLFWELFKESV